VGKHERVLVSDGGDLTVHLPGMRLVVRAGQYEAWQVAGGRGNEMFICSPSGELMHFLPFPDPPDGATTD